MKKLVSLAVASLFLLSMSVMAEKVKAPNAPHTDSAKNTAKKTSESKETKKTSDSNYGQKVEKKTETKK